MGTSKRGRFSVTMGAAAAVAMFLCSPSVQAGLIGTVASLTAIERGDPAPPYPITHAVINGMSVPVSDIIIEFDKVTAPALAIEWTLDIRNDGFSLSGNCTSDSAAGQPQCFGGRDALISLALTGMTWQPAWLQLVGVDITQATETDASASLTRDFASNITQQIQPNAMSIEFVLLGLQSQNDSVTVAGRFRTVPEPSVLSLIAIGLLGVPLLRLLRTNSGTRLS